MDAFTTLTSVIVPLDRANVDTDAIIPKQFMKSIRRTGFGDNLFDEGATWTAGNPARTSPRGAQTPNLRSTSGATPARASC